MTKYYKDAVDLLSRIVNKSRNMGDYTQDLIFAGEVLNKIKERKDYSYIVVNDWDDRTLCGLDGAWVNDGRETAHFETAKDADSAIWAHVGSEYYHRCDVLKYEADVDKPNDLNIELKITIDTPFTEPRNAFK